MAVSSCAVQKKQTEAPVSTTKPIENNAEFFSSIAKKSSFDAVKINSRLIYPNIGCGNLYRKRAKDLDEP